MYRSPRQSQPQPLLDSSVDFGRRVRPGGLEPPTLCLEGRCSVQLSYGRKINEPELRRGFREPQNIKSITIDGLQGKGTKQSRS